MKFCRTDKLIILQKSVLKIDDAFIGIQFFNAEGRVVFAVFPGRLGREVIPSVRESYFAMRREAEALAA